MNILLIALHYHEYTRNIAQELRSLGHAVRVHDIMPRDLATKALRVVSSSVWQHRLDVHHSAILAAEQGVETDMVLFIQAHQMSATNMARFKTAFQSARFVLYNWDSIANHDYRPHLDAFDQVFTFDPVDAGKLGLSYLPLFCCREFQDLPLREQEQRAIYFVGNIVAPGRYLAVADFRAHCEKQGIALKTYLACTPPAYLRMRRAGLKPKGLSFGPISHQAFLDMVASSVAVFDFANHHQSGYTMRVFENLCSGKKIITNNARIRYESFFSADRIHVFEGHDFSGVRDFINRPLAKPDADFPQYRIQAFVGHLVEGTSHPLPQSGPE